MKLKTLTLAAALIAAGTAFAEITETYVGAGAALTLPQGGSRSLRRLGGGSVRAGAYFSESLAAEGEGAWLENGSALSLRLVQHLSGWSLYDDLFGYSRFDPFVTVGVQGWIGDEWGEVGPQAGLGAFYHLTENLSLRADGAATLGLDGDCEAVYSISFGLQWSFVQ